MQLHFNLPKIDRKETRESVESIMDTYRMYLLQTSLDKLPSITAKYMLTPSSNSLPSSSTEIAAIANVSYEHDRKRFISWFLRGVNRLNYEERSVIVTRYLNDEEIYDYQAYAKLNMSERKYYRVKARAFYNLAFALKVEVYESDEVNVE